MDSGEHPATLRVDAQAGAAIAVFVAGDLDRFNTPRIQRELLELPAKARGKRIELDLSGVTRVDTAGSALFATLVSKARRLGVEVRAVSSNDAVNRAFSLFRVVAPAAAAPARRPLRERVGAAAEQAYTSGLEWIVLAVDTFYFSFAGAPRTRSVRRGSSWVEAVRIGVDALPIVGLISFLVGLVIALQSAYQLRQFGANIFVANLIGVSMTRELGPLMTAIIVAGRSGASIAAEVATMKVSEEVDALVTMGLNPTRYIVVPKFIGISLTMPCLTMYANVLGIIGGFLVALLYLDISATAFFSQLHRTLVFKDIGTGLIKSMAFAWLICLIAAHQGFRAEGGAESVGQVTTTSVVSSIFWVIVADAVFSILFYFGD
jgi:phospholipid/cholesterol/gamma-HCH transport system permease protein